MIVRSVPLQDGREHCNDSYNTVFGLGSFRVLCCNLCTFRQSSGPSLGLLRFLVSSGYVGHLPMTPKKRVIFVFQIVREHLPDMLGAINRSLQALEDNSFDVKFCDSFRSLLDLVLKCPKAP